METESNNNPQTAVESTGLVARLRNPHIHIFTDNQWERLLNEAADHIESLRSAMDAMEAAWGAVDPGSRDRIADRVSANHKGKLQKLNAALGEWIIETYTLEELGLSATN